jgi:hypothetical protein
MAKKVVTVSAIGDLLNDAHPYVITAGTMHV